MATNIGGADNPVFVTNDSPDRPITGGAAQPVYVTNFSEVSSSNSPNASITERGIIELATTAEANAGTDTERAVVPSGLPLRIIGTGLKGPDFTQGNPGANAIDIQTSRSSANHIASGANAVAIGVQARASGAGSIAIGDTPSASQTNAIAIGDATAAGVASVSVGEGANVLSAAGAGVAIGNAALSNDVNAVAVGNGAQSAGVAVGNNAIAGDADAVAIGPNVNNPEPETVMIGVSGLDYLHFTGFTPAADVVAQSTHTLTINISGVVYKVLLATP